MRNNLCLNFLHAWIKSFMATCWLLEFLSSVFFKKIGIHSVQNWTATARHMELQEKEAQKD